MLKAFVLPRRSAIASFAPTLADQYRHPNGTVMTVRRVCFWRRDWEACNWAVNAGYSPVGRPKLSLWAEHGFTSA